MERINKLLRDSIRQLKPYSSARDEFSGKANIMLDANENPFENSINRYPDPHQGELKKVISTLKEIPTESIFLGNGSDEAVDLLIRAFCEPGTDSILITEPTYGMYSVCAAVNNVKVINIPLNPDFNLDATRVDEILQSNSKIIFLCSPNNPSGNLLDETLVLQIISGFKGIVVVDEAYIDFAERPSMIQHLASFPNLVILQTFSKAWGMAGLRLGMAFANPFLVSILNKIKYPYNINICTQETALKRLATFNPEVQLKTIISEREVLAQRLNQHPEVILIHPSSANFLLVRFKNPKAVFHYLLGLGIIVRDRSSVPGCEGCLRITVGTPEENSNLILALNTFNQQ